MSQYVCVCYWVRLYLAPRLVLEPTEKVPKSDHAEFHMQHASIKAASMSLGEYKKASPLLLNQFDLFNSLVVLTR